MLINLEDRGLVDQVSRIQVDLFGSLSATGVGHGTDNSIVVGLMGERPATIDPEIILPTVAALKEHSRLNLLNKKEIEFEWQRDMRLLNENLDFHPNAMRLSAFSADGSELFSNTYYSIGGGFVIDESEASADAHLVPQVELPYEFNNAAELLKLCQENNLRVSELMMENEKVWRSEAEIRSGLIDIWAAMKDCIANGLHKEGSYLVGSMYVDVQ